MRVAQKLFLGMDVPLVPATLVPPVQFQVSVGQASAHRIIKMCDVHSSLQVTAYSMHLLLGCYQALTVSEQPTKAFFTCVVQRRIHHV